MLNYFLRLLYFKQDYIVSTDLPAVSVIIAARNEAENLPSLLDAILSQKHPSFEVIVVNDRSEDNSLDILHAYQKQDSKVKLIDIEGLPAGWNGKKFAIKQGVEMAQNDLILLTDADCLPKSDQWITQMTHNFNPSSKFVLGFSPYQERTGFLNHFIRFETLWTGIQYLSFTLKGLPYMGVGRNMAYRKSALLNDGFKGIQDITGGDDDLLINRLANHTNTKIAITPESQTISIPKADWRSYVTQKIRHLSVGIHYSKKDRTRLGLFSLCNLFGWISFFCLLILGFNPLWILAVYGSRSILFYIIFTRMGQKLGVRLIPLTLPLLDLFYNLFYLVVGLRALTAKRIKWS